MRLTTKIFLGFLLSILSCILIFMLYLKTTETNFNSHFNDMNWELSKEIESVEVAPYEVVSIQRNKARISLEGYITTHKGDLDKIEMNKDLIEYTTLDVQNDTLFIKIEDDLILKRLTPDDDTSVMYSYPRAQGLQIRLPEQKTINICSQERFDFYLEDIEIDTLKLDIAGDNNFTINNGKIKTLSFDNKIANSYHEITFKFDNTFIGEWNIDAYYVDTNYSEINNSKIDVLNIRAVGECDLPYIPYKTLNWLPLNENANLKIKLTKPTTIEMKE